MKPSKPRKTKEHLKALVITPDQVASLALPLRTVRVETFQKHFLVVQPRDSAPKIPKDWLTQIDEVLEQSFPYELNMTAVEFLAQLTKDVVAFERYNDYNLLALLRKHCGSVVTGRAQFAFEGARTMLEELGYPAEGVFGEASVIKDLKIPHKFSPSYGWMKNSPFFFVTSDRTRTGVMLTSPLSVEIKGEWGATKDDPNTATLNLRRTASFLVDPKALVCCTIPIEKGV